MRHLGEVFDDGEDGYVKTVGKLLNDDSIFRKAYQMSSLSSWTLLHDSNLVMFLLTLVADWGFSVLLSFFAFPIIFVYASIDFSSQGRVLFWIVGPLFTVWNIAQYASFAIQTTGHTSVGGLLRALKLYGPKLGITAGTGWALIALWFSVYYGGSFESSPDRGIPPVLVHIVIAAAAIVPGIFLKTYQKLKYIWDKHNPRKDTHHLDDTMVGTDKLICMTAQYEKGELKCPFAVLDMRLTAIWCTAPIICFLWTVLFTLIFVALFRALDNQLWYCFLVSMSIFFFLLGQQLLRRWITDARGSFTYSDDMCIAFSYIYGLVTVSQMRLGLSYLHTNTPQYYIFVVLQPVMCSLVPILRSTRIYEHEMETLLSHPIIVAERSGKEIEKSAEQSNVEILRTFADINNRCNRAVIFASGALITGNVGSSILVMLSCAFHGNDRVSFGECEGGLFRALLSQCTPVWACDLIAIGYLVYKSQMPCFHFFRQLDPFLVLAMVLVTYETILLLIWVKLPWTE